jgi:hypothetical protein
VASDTDSAYFTLTKLLQKIDPNSDSCKLGMKNYCVGDNLTQISCMEFCKTADCDTNIKNFCNPPNSTYYQKKKKYTKKKDKKR